MSEAQEIYDALLDTIQEVIRERPKTEYRDAYLDALYYFKYRIEEGWDVQG